MNSLKGCFFMCVLFCEAQSEEEQRGVPCSPKNQRPVEARLSASGPLRSDALNARIHKGQQCVWVGAGLGLSCHDDVACQLVEHHA